MPNNLRTFRAKSKRATPVWPFPHHSLIPTLLLSLALSLGQSALAQEVGITPTAIKLGGVMALEGDASGLGQGIKKGLEAAFRNQTAKNRAIELTVLNDFYNPDTTVEKTKQLIDSGIFAMIGNVGTPTARVSLPLLAENGVPSIGFFTGAGLLRPGDGDIVNFRASYVQEVSTVIDAALQAGIKPTEICAYVQNDAYGMAGIAGFINAFSNLPEAQEIVAILTSLMQMEGESPQRNYQGPVGVYERNTLVARDGYDSLKVWEEVNGSRCRLVVTVGAYTPIAQFVSYARFKGDDWITSAVSFTGAFNLRDALAENSIQDGIIMTQVVPPLDSELPIVQQARDTLKTDLSYVSLEGYIVGRMFLYLLDQVEGAPTRQNFLNKVRGQRYEMDGLVLDFSTDNQASDLVTLTLLSGSDYQVIDADQLKQAFAQ